MPETKLDDLTPKLKKIMLQGKTYVGIEGEDGQLTSACLLTSGNIDRVGLAKWIQAWNLDALEEIGMKGNFEYQTTELSAEEKNILDSLISEFNIAKKTAVARLENEMFMARVGLVPLEMTEFDKEIRNAARRY